MASTIVNNVSCNGSNDGYIDLTASGSSGFSYLWSTGDTTEDINNTINWNYKGLLL